MAGKMRRNRGCGMKAIVIREFGGPEVLRWEEVPTHTPGPDEVLVRVHAVSVNRTVEVMLNSPEFLEEITSTWACSSHPFPGR
jgi:NADPH:quinone reductase